MQLVTTDQRWRVRPNRRNLQNDELGDHAIAEAQEAGTQVTVVTTPDQLSGAVQQGVRHIEVRGHMDLTTLMPQKGAASSVPTLLGDVPATVNSITGNCTTAPATGAIRITGDPLAAVRSRQCVMLADQGIMSVSLGELWVSSLFFRSKATPRAADKKPALMDVRSSGKLWMSDVTVQGQGEGESCQAVQARAPLHCADCQFIGVGGDSSGVNVEAATAVLASSHFHNSTFSADTSAVRTRYLGAATHLRDVQFTNVTAKYPVRVVDGAAIFSDPAGVRVYDERTDRNVSAQGVAEAPANVVFLGAEDEFLVAQKEALADLPKTAFVPFKEVGKGSGAGTNIAAIVGSIVAAVIVVIVVTMLSRRRRRGHSFNRDAWGLPANPVKQPQKRTLSNMQHSSFNTNSLPHNASQHSAPALSRSGSKGAVLLSTADNTFVTTGTTVHDPAGSTGGVISSAQLMQAIAAVGPVNGGSVGGLYIPTQAGGAAGAPHQVARIQSVHNVPAGAVLATTGESIPSSLPDGPGTSTTDVSGAAAAAPQPGMAGVYIFTPVSQDGSIAGAPVAVQGGPGAGAPRAVPVPIPGTTPPRPLLPQGGMAGSAPSPAAASNAESVSERQGLPRISPRTVGEVEVVRNGGAAAGVAAGAAAGAPQSPAAFLTPPVYEGCYAPPDGLSQAAQQPARPQPQPQLVHEGSGLPLLTDPTGTGGSLPYWGNFGISGSVATPSRETTQTHGGATASIAVEPMEPASTLQGPLTTMGGSLAGIAAPSEGATAEDAMNFVEMQLDSLTDGLVLNGFQLLGATERRRGGQALIQFAKRPRGRAEFAIKFFLNRADYDAEVALYRNSCLGTFLPAVEAYVDNLDGSLSDTAGNPLPPCIVMERGDSLYDRMAIALTDKAGTAQVLVNIAKRLSSLHLDGWVHRDLKPGNVMWLPRKQRWTLIDFGLAARVGCEAATSFTPTYAAPEVVKAYKSNQSTVTAQPSMDAWALGVMAFELLTGKPAFEKYQGGAEKVYSQLLGQEPLPWEGDRFTDDIQRQLGVFKPSVMALLAREPERRPSLHDFAASCEAIFEAPSGTAFSFGGTLNTTV